MFLNAEENLTIPQIFSKRAASFRSRPALCAKDKQTRLFYHITWDEWSRKVKETALGLYARGVRRGDKVAILSENRPEWTYCDLGVLSLGATVVPIYPTSSLEDILYILNNAEVETLIVSSEELLNRVVEIKWRAAKLRQLICLDACSKRDPAIIQFNDLLLKGAAEPSGDEVYRKHMESGDPEDIATLIYTSGTTGPAKGVMLTHSNFVANYIGAREKIHIGPSDSALSFLPLSHVFERLAGYYFMAFHGAMIAYAENMQTVSEDIQLIKPTICAAVPRFYEKVHAKIIENIEKGSERKKKIFYWAVSVGRERSRCCVSKKTVPFVLSLKYAIAKALVFNKIKKKMGGRLRFFISGGAPLSKELAEFFFAADILILEGYGLTETSPVIAVNSAEDFRFGTVGKPLRNVEVRIAEDGEIITRGPCVMKGYYANPQATSEALEGGWFHTGDIGAFEDGFLKITDRKKDIIATSGGKKVSPQNIESKILSDNLFLQAVILGDKRNYLVALLVLNRPLVESYAQEVAPKLNYTEMLKHPAILAWVEKRFRARTEGLASYEQIKYYALLENEFTQESGELTPTLKCKRRFIMEKYKDTIDALYAQGIQGASHEPA